MREALSQPSLSMAQNDVVSVEIRFLLLRLLVEISLRITWVLVAKVQEGHDVGDVTETKGRHAAQGWLWEGKEFCEQEITDAAQGHPDGDQQAEGRERSVLCEEVPAPGCKHQGT